MGDATGELDDFLTAATSPSGVGEDLAVLGGDDLGQLALAGVEQFPEGEQDVVRLASEVSRHAGGGGRCRVDDARASATSARASSPVTWPVAGLVTSPKRPELPMWMLLSSQWPMTFFSLMPMILRRRRLGHNRQPVAESTRSFTQCQTRLGA